MHWSPMNCIYVCIFLDFRSGKAPILVATDVAARGLGMWTILPKACFMFNKLRVYVLQYWQANSITLVLFCLFCGFLFLILMFCFVCKIAKKPLPKALACWAVCKGLLYVTWGSLNKVGESLFAEALADIGLCLSAARHRLPSPAACHVASPWCLFYKNCWLKPGCGAPDGGETACIEVAPRLALTCAG